MLSSPCSNCRRKRPTSSTATSSTSFALLLFTAALTICHADATFPGAGGIGSIWNEDDESCCARLLHKRLAGLSSQSSNAGAVTASSSDGNGTASSTALSLTEGTPQYLAYQWLSSLPTQNAYDDDDDDGVTAVDSICDILLLRNLEQVYGLAVLYFSTSSLVSDDDWTRGGAMDRIRCYVDPSLRYGMCRWLSSVEVCEWYGVHCDERERVTQLNLGSNNLVGTIPPELQHLSDLKILDMNDNALMGVLPPALPEGLVNLNLGNNEISGELDGGLFFDLRELEILSLNSNQFMGQIPWRYIMRLRKLVEVQLQDNNLYGEAPTSFCSSTNNAYAYFVLDCTEVMCECCQASAFPYKECDPLSHPTANPPMAVAMIHKAKSSSGSSFRLRLTMSGCMSLYILFLAVHILIFLWTAIK